MMDTKKLIERSELATAGKLSSADCQRLADELMATTRELSTELESLGLDTQGNPMPGRVAALGSGNPAEVVKLKARTEELEALGEMLDWHRQRVLAAQKEARKRELPETAKRAAKSIPAALKALEAAMKKQAEARAALAELQSQLLAARHEAMAGGMDFASRTSKAFDAVAALDSDTAARVIDALDRTAERPAAADNRTLAANRRHQLAALTGIADEAKPKWVKPDDAPAAAYL